MENALIQKKKVLAAEGTIIARPGESAATTASVPRNVGLLQGHVLRGMCAKREFVW